MPDAGVQEDLVRGGAIRIADAVLVVGTVSGVTGGDKRNIKTVNLKLKNRIVTNFSSLNR